MSAEKATGSLAPTSLSDKAVSYIRTFSPIVWGSIVTWLAANVPALTDFFAGLNIDLSSQSAVGVFTAAAIAVWYVVWRAVEKYIPNWLTALVLGSSKQPAYVGTPGAPEVMVDPEVISDDNQTEFEEVSDEDEAVE